MSSVLQHMQSLGLNPLGKLPHELEEEAESLVPGKVGAKLPKDFLERAPFEVDVLPCPDGVFFSHDDLRPRPRPLADGGTAFEVYGDSATTKVTTVGPLWLIPPDPTASTGTASAYGPDGPVVALVVEWSGEGPADDAAGFNPFSKTLGDTRLYYFRKTGPDTAPQAGWEEEFDFGAVAEATDSVRLLEQLL